MPPVRALRMRGPSWERWPIRPWPIGPAAGFGRGAFALGAGAAFLGAAFLARVGAPPAMAPNMPFWAWERGFPRTVPSVRICFALDWETSVLLLGSLAITVYSYPAP